MGELRKRLTQAMDVFFEAPCLNLFKGTLARRISYFRGSKNLSECFCQCADVSHGKGISFHAISDEVRLTAEVVGDDDGLCRIHSLVDDQAPGFVSRRQDEDGAEIEEPWQLGLVAKAAESDIFQAVYVGLLFESGSLFSISDDQEIGVWPIAPTADEIFIGVQ